MVHVLWPGRSGFPDRLEPDEHGLVAIGGQLDADTLIEAYCRGAFPWTGEHPIPWFSPDPRLVLYPERFHASRSLRKVIRQGRFEVAFDRDFAATIRGCASAIRPGQPGTWITPNMVRAYTELHWRGIAHSVETYRDDELVGGLYGLTFGRAFFGESMFARDPDASKVALHALCARLRAWEFHFVDCQEVTGHLLRLGATPLPRSAYLERLRRALAHRSIHRRWT